jgi:hypothetical protein
VYVQMKMHSVSLYVLTSRRKKKTEQVHLWDGIRSCLCEFVVECTVRAKPDGISLKPLHCRDPNRL